MVPAAHLWVRRCVTVRGLLATGSNGMEAEGTAMADRTIHLHVLSRLAGLVPVKYVGLSAPVPRNARRSLNLVPVAPQR